MADMELLVHINLQQAINIECGQDLMRIIVVGIGALSILLGHRNLLLEELAVRFAVSKNYEAGNIFCAFIISLSNRKL